MTSKLLFPNMRWKSDRFCTRCGSDKQKSKFRSERRSDCAPPRMSLEERMRTDHTDGPEASEPVFSSRSTSYHFPVMDVACEATPNRTPRRFMRKGAQQLLGTGAVAVQVLELGAVINQTQPPGPWMIQLRRFARNSSG